MRMSSYEGWSIGIAATQSIVLIVVLVVYARQLKAMQQQVETAKNAAVGQNFLALSNFLQAEDVREARRIVIADLAGREFKEWSEEETRAAAKVCSTYGTAGIVIETGLVPSNLLLENWGPSIRRCSGILGDFVKDLQSPEKNGSDYWAVYDRLCARVGSRSKTGTMQPNV
jgi:hypothetical protein